MTLVALAGAGAKLAGQAPDPAVPDKVDRPAAASPPGFAVRYQVIDRGYFTFRPSFSSGCYGETFPTLRPVWVPCLVAVPVPVPLPTPAAPEPKEPERQPLPKNAATPVSLIQTVSGGGRPAPPRTVAPTYHTHGLRPADAPTIFWQGYRLYQGGLYAQALVRFDVAIRLAGNDARYWYFKSLSETALGQTDAAKKSLDRAVELHLQGKPNAALIGASLERVQGPARQQLRDALDAQRAAASR